MQRPFFRSHWDRISEFAVVWMGVVFFAGAGWGNVSGALLDKVEVRARTLAETGSLKEAKQEVQEALLTESKALEKAALHELMGDLRCAQSPSSAQESIPDYTKALELDPKNGRLFFKRGQAGFFQLSLRESALNDLVSSLKMGYTNANTFYMMGSACKYNAESSTNMDSASKSYVLAYSLYQRALQVDTNHVPALGNLGDMAYNFGRHEEAADYYRRVLKLKPGSDQTVYCKTRLAHVEIKLRHFGDAVALLGEAEKYYARQPVPADTLAMLNWRLEGLRVLSYKLEALSEWGKKEEALVASRELTERLNTARKAFDGAGYNSEALDDVERMNKQRAKDLQ